MAILYLIPPVIGFVLLAAHFLRGENQLAALVSLLMVVLVFVRRPWAARTIQACLLLGSVEWLRSATSLVLSRSEMGEPFLRLAVILGGVALFTALSSLVFRTSILRDHFEFGSVADSKEQS
jgi:prepilin signal peptidase PulO-like enzyme (type II secretory pathway)